MTELKTTYETLSEALTELEEDDQLSFVNCSDDINDYESMPHYGFWIEIDQEALANEDVSKLYGFLKGHCDFESEQIYKDTNTKTEIFSLENIEIAWNILF